MKILCWIVDFLATVLEIALFYKVLNTVYHIAYKKIFAVYIISGACLIILFNQIALFSQLNMLLFFFVITAGGCLKIKKNFFHILSIATFYNFFIGSFEFSYASILMSQPLFGKDLLAVILQVGFPRILFIVSCKAGEICCVFLFCWLIKRLNVTKPAPWQLFILAASGYIGVIYMIQQTFSSYNADVPVLWMAIFSGLLLLLFILLFEIDLRQRRSRLERELLNQKLLEEKYESLNELYTRNARLYHDLNNHLNTLYHILDGNDDTQKAREYIRTISKPIRDLRKVTWTGNDIVDVVLNSKLHMFENAGIPYQIDVNCPAESGILPSDLCSILSNSAG